MVRVASDYHEHVQCQRLQAEQVHAQVVDALAFVRQHYSAQASARSPERDCRRAAAAGHAKHAHDDLSPDRAANDRLRKDSGTLAAHAAALQTRMAELSAALESARACVRAV